jgi:host factor-I protein
MANQAPDKSIDRFLHESLRESRTVEVFLRDGARFTGRIVGHDRYSILLDHQGVEYMLYKSSVARVTRQRKGHNTRTFRNLLAGSKSSPPIADNA